MSELQLELQHLIALMAPPWRDYWAQYCWIKAKGLAQHDPDTYRDLPRLLTDAMQSASSAATATPSEPS